MYLQHFGLRYFPFDKEVPIDELFASQAMDELKTRLDHLVELRGIGLVTGDSGSGKSTACRRMALSLHTGLYRVVYVPLSTGNPMDVYKSIAWELGLATERSRAALYRQIRNEVTRLCTEARQHTLLILDDAQNLRSDVLEELRLLTNYAMDSENRLGMILCGQPELRRRVNMAVHEPLNQRIVMRYHLAPLGRDEIEGYLTHLLRRAGTELSLFEPQAVEALYQASRGLPRKLNLLAHHTLIAAALVKAQRANDEHVQAALPEVT